jgi:FkbM family methyltransferase
MIESSHQIVATAYKLLLDRDPEPAGLHYWSSALESGLARAEFIRAVLESDEFQARMDLAETLVRYDDVDLVIPVGNSRFMLPASDRWVVPHLLKYRSWEPHLTRFLRRELRPAHTFIDVGANFGYFTVLCAPLVERVIAFEPARRTHRYCESNVAFNRLTNVELHRCGLWVTAATLHMLNDPHDVNAAITSSGDSGSLEPIEVVSLDGLIGSRGLQLSRLDMIKMDIEGAELSALRGMKRTLARFRPAMVMEVNRPALAACGASVDEVWDFLTGMGYEIRAFEAWQPRDPDPVATLADLKARCGDDSLIDILAVP